MKSILLAFALLISLPTLAQTAQPAADKRPIPKVLTQSEKRGENRVVLLAQPFGLELTNTIDVIVGASAGYYVTPDLITSVGLEYASSLAASDYGQHDSITTVEGSAQYFLFGSFYAKGGMFYRNINSFTYGNYSTANADGTRNKSTTSLNEIGASVGIGNQWQIHHFVIGCDWITYDLPVIWGSLSADSKIDVYSTNLQFVKLHVGASF